MPEREEPRFIPYAPDRPDTDEVVRRGREFESRMTVRRSVRHFSSDPVPREAIEIAIRTAASAPSGANRQPWLFVAVDDPGIKKRIRAAAEKEERISYEGGRMPVEWREALAPLGTDWHKPYLETAPWLVVLFEEVHGVRPDGGPRKNYYGKESVGIACGLFVAALQSMGLCTLTHTPSPMGFLRTILGRPLNERPYMLFPVGYAAPDAQVPDLTRKTMDEVALWNPGPER